jgi:hypothetical protein
LGAAGALGAVATFVAMGIGATAEPDPARVEHAPPPAVPIKLDAAQIASGRISMERLPAEISQALESQSQEIVKNAEALESKQARITGTCAPGSAIRVIGEDGTVSCQRLPKGVVSVSALAAVPLNAATTTTVGSVPGAIGRYQTSGEDDMLVIPVSLPDGAIVTSFSFVYYDSHERLDGAAYLYRSDAQTMAEVLTSGASDQVRMGTTDHIELKKVDATRFAYLVLFRISAQAAGALLPISAAVSYRIP